MNLKYLIVTIIGLIALSNGIAQSSVDLPPFMIHGKLMSSIVSHKQDEVIGSHLLLPEFHPGKIELVKNQIYSDVMVNYDAYSDNLIITNDQTGLMEINKMLISKFTMNEGEDQYVFIKKSIDGNPTFLLSLFDSASFYCRIKRKIERANTAYGYRVEQRNSKLVTEITYFIERKGVFVKVRKNLKGMLAAFPNHEKELSKYLRQNKVDFNDYKQVALVLSYAFTN